MHKLQNKMKIIYKMQTKLEIQAKISLENKSEYYGSEGVLLQYRKQW